MNPNLFTIRKQGRQLYPTIATTSVGALTNLKVGDYLTGIILKNKEHNCIDTCGFHKNDLENLLSKEKIRAF